MEVIKLTDKYDFYQEGNDYILNLGQITSGEDTKTELLFKGFTDLTLSATCGCTVADKEKRTDGTTVYSITYNQCSPSFSRVLVGKSKEKQFKLKVKGVCK